MPDDERPPLRDRNWFFHHLLNGSRDEYERVAPRWQEQRRMARWAEQRGPAETPEPVNRATDIDNSGRRSQRHQAERVKVESEKKIGRSCWWLLRSIRAAHRRIRRANTRRARDEAALAAVSQDVKEIADRLDVVRRRALRLHRRLGPDSPFDHDEVLSLDVAGGDNDHKARKRTYQHLTAVLDAYERHAVKLRRDINTRRKAFKRAERARRAAG